MPDIDTENPVRTLSWAAPFRNLWVATVRNQQAGIVEFVDGHFAATDAATTLTRTFGTLREAKQALERPDVRMGAGEPARKSGMTGRFALRDIPAMRRHQRRVNSPH